MFNNLKSKINLKFFRFYIFFNKNKFAHKKDVINLFKEFIYYCSETWRNNEGKEEALENLYKKFSKVIEKSLRGKEDIDNKRYLFYYFLLDEEVLNPVYYQYKSNKPNNIKNVFKDFTSLIYKAALNDGYYTQEEFSIEIEKLKRRYKKEIREINKDLYEYTYKTRKNFYPQIKNYFKNKFKSKENK